MPEVATGETPSTSSDTRQLKFPGAKSLGSLVLISERPQPFHDRLDKSTPIAVAKGTVKITVPAGKLLLLEANEVVFQNPRYLDEISPPSIDALKIGFMGMRDDEYGICDRALAHVGRFTNLQLLDASQSDATDAGISHLKSMKHLREISMTESRVTGACLKDLISLPLLTDLKLDRCTISSPQLAALKKFPALRHLELRWSNIDNQAAKFACDCAKLELLDLSRNKKLDDGAVKEIGKLKKLEELVLSETSVTDAAILDICKAHDLKALNMGSTLVTDESLKTIAKMKRLQKLHLERTKVTTAGLKLLQDLKLTELTLPRASYDKAERARLTQMFPGTKFFIIPANGATDELQKMYGPIPQ